MDLSSLAPQTQGLALATSRPAQPGADTRRIEPRSGADGAGLSGRETAAGDIAAAEIRAAKQRAIRDENQPAGPPPSFEVNQLDMARDLKQILARLESARAHDRDASAVQPDPQAEQQART